MRFLRGSSASMKETHSPRIFARAQLDGVTTTDGTIAGSRHVVIEEFSRLRCRGCMMSSVPLRFFLHNQIDNYIKTLTNQNILRWQSGLKMTKKCDFSELKKTRTNVFLRDKGTFSENLRWLLRKTLKIWGFKVHGRGSHIDLHLWWYAFMDGNYAVLNVNNGSGPGNAYQHHNAKLFHRPSSKWSIASNSTFKWLILQRWISKRSSEPKCMLQRRGLLWQLCPQTHSVVLNLWRGQLLLPPHDAMYWLLLSSTSCRRWTWKLVPSWPGPWSAVVHIMVSGRLPVQRKRVKRERGGQEKGSQDKELATEGVQYEAEERWTAGLTLTHDFHLHYSSSIVLLYPKLLHFFYLIRATPRHHTSFSSHPTPIHLYIFENCKEILRC